MAERPYVSFAEVKERVSIPDVLARLGLLDSFTRKGDRLWGVCPLPEHKHGPRPNDEQFKIDCRDGVWLWKCWGDCGRGGDVLELAKLLTGYNNAHVRLWFAEHFGDRLTLTKPTAQPSRAKKEACDGHPAKDYPPQASVTDSSIVTNELAPLKPLSFFLRLDPTVPYLANRGLKPETIERYGLGLCNRGYLKGYIAIPIYGYPHPQGANPFAYLGRWPGEDYDEAAGRPRYKWPKDFASSRVVYGLTQAMATEPGTPLVVVEGVFKALHLMQCGIFGAVSCFTAGMSDEQSNILAATRRPIIIMFDGNAHESAYHTAHKLVTRASVRIIPLPAAQEPDELTEASLRDLLC